MKKLEINWYWSAKMGRKVQIIETSTNNVLAIFDVLDLDKITACGGDNTDPEVLIDYANDWKGTDINASNYEITITNDY